MTDEIQLALFTGIIVGVILTIGGGYILGAILLNRDDTRGRK
jgi:hypothetical protein